MKPSDTFRVIIDPNFRTHTFNNHTLNVGFCPDDTYGDGYCDGKLVWIRPGMKLERVIEVSIHEGIHACFPTLSEEEVKRCGGDIAAFVMKVLSSTRDDFNYHGKAPINPDAVYEFLKANRRTA